MLAEDDRKKDKPERVKHQCDTPNPVWCALGNVGRGKELHTADSHSREQFSDKLPVSLMNNQLSERRVTQTSHRRATTSSVTETTRNSQRTYIPHFRPNFAARLISQHPITRLTEYQENLQRHRDHCYDLASGLDRTDSSQD